MSDGSNDNSPFCCLGGRWCLGQNEEQNGRNLDQPLIFYFPVFSLILAPEEAALLNQPTSQAVFSIAETIVTTMHTTNFPDVNAPTITVTGLDEPSTSTASDTAQASTSMDTSVEMQAPENDPSADQATPEMGQLEKESVE
jgi:hypothetical protein